MKSQKARLIVEVYSMEKILEQGKYARLELTDEEWDDLADQIETLALELGYAASVGIKFL